MVEVPRVVQNPPKPVMTTRPTAVKATGTGGGGGGGGWGGGGDFCWFFHLFYNIFQ